MASPPEFMDRIGQQGTAGGSGRPNRIHAALSRDASYRHEPCRKQVHRRSTGGILCAPDGAAVPLMREAVVDVRKLAGAITARGLHGASDDWPPAPLDDEAWKDLVAIVRQERLGGLLLDAVQHGALPVTPQQELQARRLQMAGVGQVLLIEAAALGLIGTLTRAGIDVRVLKGSAAAHLDYPDPVLRHFVDLDLMVKSEDFDRAVDVFVQAGHPRRHRQPRPGFDRRFSKGTSFVVSEHLTVDLHRTFVMGPFGLRVDLGDVWQASAEFDLGGMRVRALDREVRFLHACFHAALGDVPPRLVPQRDVAQLLLDERLDVSRVASLMRWWGARAVVAKAVTESWTTLQPSRRPDLVAWAEAYRPSRREARELAMYSDPESGYARKSMGALRAVPGLRGKAAFAFALTFPDRSYVEGRYAGPGQRLVQGLRALGRRVGPGPT